MNASITSKDQQDKKHIRTYKSKNRSNLNHVSTNPVRTSSLEVSQMLSDKTNKSKNSNTFKNVDIVSKSKILQKVDDSIRARKIHKARKQNNSASAFKVFQDPIEKSSTDVDRVGINSIEPTEPTINSVVNVFEESVKDAQIPSFKNGEDSEDDLIAGKGEFASMNKNYFPQNTQAPPIDSLLTSLLLQNSEIVSAATRPPASPVDWSPDITSCVDSNTWGITYDDGPSIYTKVALNSLSKRGLRATFFVIGSNVLKNPQILIDTYNAGHSIGIHAWSHPYLTTLTNDEIIAEIIWTARIIKEVIGVTPILVRPPFGDIDERVRSILLALGLKIVIWNRDSNDWKYSTYKGSLLAQNCVCPSSILADFKEWVSEPHKGSISLQHDFFSVTSSFIPETLDILVRSGYNLKDVPDCIGILDIYNDQLLINAGILKSDSTNAETPSMDIFRRKSNSDGIFKFEYFIYIILFEIGYIILGI